MWIIVEGPTCSGKSTLERHLSRLMASPTLKKVHMERPAELTRRWVLSEYALKWERWTPNDGDILADRWHWGEATYSPIYRPGTNKDGFGLLGVAGWRWVELFLMSRGAMTAFLRAEPDVLKHRFISRGDDHVKGVDELLQVSKLYDTTYEVSQSSNFVWDTSAPEYKETQQVSRMLLDSAKILDNMVSPLREFPGYIGRPDPLALLVGDKRNVTKVYGEETRLPFMPINGNSGDYLMRALPEDWWSQVGIVNSAEYPTSLRSLWVTLGQPPVVALGTDAFVRLKEAGVPSAGVQHPQYARRFRHHEIEQYGEKIRAAAQGQES